MQGFDVAILLRLEHNAHEHGLAACIGLEAGVTRLFLNCFVCYSLSAHVFKFGEHGHFEGTFDTHD